MSHILKEIIKNVSVDCVVFGYEKNVLEVLFVRRAIQPHKGMWALPGGFVKKDELIQDAAARVLRATTGVDNLYLEQVGVFDRVDRYPARRVFTVGHFALVSPKHYTTAPGTDTSEVRWFRLDESPELPFDHREILDAALGILRRRIRVKPIGFELLPGKFTLPQLQNLYEELLGHEIDKRNFRKKVLKLGLLRKLTEVKKTKKGRTPALYMFDAANYKTFKERGFSFEL